MPNFVKKLENLNQQLAHSKRFPFQKGTNRLTKIVFGSYYEKQFENEEDIVYTDEDHFLWIDLEKAELFLPCNAWNIDYTLALTLLKNNNAVAEEMFTAILAFLHVSKKKSHNSFNPVAKSPI